MHHRSITVACGSLLLALSAGCVSVDAHENALAANRALQSERDDLERAYAELEADRDRLLQAYDKAMASAKDAAWLQEKRKEWEQLEQELAKLRERSAAIEGIDVRQDKEGTIFEIQGEILFRSGEAVVTEGGRAKLAELVAVIRDEGRPIRVQGHTDTDPIRKSQWASNLALSAGRALAVAEVLIDAGMPAEQVSVAGYGEYKERPDNPGKDPEARKRWNRRVEILMLEP